MLSRELATLQLSDELAATPPASVDGRGGKVDALSLPIELWLRIISLDMGGIGRLSERLARETALRLVCGRFSDVVIAMRPDDEHGRTSAKITQRGLATLVDPRWRDLSDEVGALRRVYVRLVPQHVCDAPCAELGNLLCLLASASQLEELEVTYALQRVSMFAASHMQNLRSVALLACRCSGSAVGCLLGSQTLESVETDEARASRTRTRGAWSLWSIEMRLDGDPQAHRWIEELLSSAGELLRRIYVEAETVLGAIDFSARCPHLRHLDVRQVRSGGGPMLLPALRTLRLLTENPLSMRRAILATGARSIELGLRFSAGEDAALRQLSKSEFLNVLQEMHDTSPRRSSISFLDAVDQCLALHDLLADAGNVRIAASGRRR